MRNFEIDKITYWNPEPIATYDGSKNKPSLYP